jgi:hypothetical protein
MSGKNVLTDVTVAQNNDIVLDVEAAVKIKVNAQNR